MPTQVDTHAACLSPQPLTACKSRAPWQVFEDLQHKTLCQDTASQDSTMMASTMSSERPSHQTDWHLPQARRNKHGDADSGVRFKECLEKNRGNGDASRIYSRCFRKLQEPKIFESEKPRVWHAFFPRISWKSARTAPDVEFDAL